MSVSGADLMGHRVIISFLRKQEESTLELQAFQPAHMVLLTVNMVSCYIIAKDWPLESSIEHLSFTHNCTVLVEEFVQCQK